MKKVLLHFIAVLILASAIDVVWSTITAHTFDTHASPSIAHNNGGGGSSSSSSSSDQPAHTNTILKSADTQKVITTFCTSEQLPANDISDCNKLAKPLKKTFKLFKSTTLTTSNAVQDAWLKGQSLSDLGNSATTKVAESDWITALESADSSLKTFIEANKQPNGILDDLFKLKVTDLQPS